MQSIKRYFFVSLLVFQSCTTFNLISTLYKYGYISFFRLIKIPADNSNILYTRELAQTLEVFIDKYLLSNVLVCVSYKI